MKKTKVIIPALGILLLSTAASVTGTVAWFSANSSVDATGMKVTALSSNLFLQIANSDGDSSNPSKTAAAAVTEAQDLFPVDYKSISSVDDAVWGKTTSNDPSDPNYTLRDSLTTVQAADLDNYIWTDTFDFWVVASNGQTADNLKLTSVTVTGSSDLAPALRVLVVGDDAAMLWYNTNASENETALTGGISVVNYKEAATAPTGFLKVVPNGQSNAATARVYVYYCGNDDCVTTDRAQSLAELTVSLSFDVDHSA